VLPKALKARVSIEAGVTFGWHRVVGDRGLSIGVDRFGASAPDKVLLQQYGITAKAVVAAVQQLVTA
jgi:transketolase